MTRASYRLTRRQFARALGAIGVGLLTRCALPFSQSRAPARLPRIGWLGTAPRENLAPPEPGTSEPLDGFFEGLRELGYEEGRTHTFVWRQTDRGEERLREFAVELVQMPVDVIVAGAGTGPLARQATETIPIILMGGGDPVVSGLVASYARPGGNVTGVPAAPAGEYIGKLLELLKEASPSVSRVGILFDANLPGLPLGPDDAVPHWARTLGLHLQPMGVLDIAELAGAFTAALQAGIDGLLVIESALFGPTNLAQVAGLALRHRLPSIGLFRGFARVGGLLAYGPSVRQTARRGASYVDKILKGADPATLPVELPREFDFVINLQTASALGLTIPQHVLLQATELIQ